MWEQLEQAGFQNEADFTSSKSEVEAKIHNYHGVVIRSRFKIDKDFIAGGFGNFLNIKNVIRTGLIECNEEKIIKLGNTALIGAKMFLFEEENFTKNILNKTMHTNLEGDSTFQDVYIEKMMLL